MLVYLKKVNTSQELRERVNPLERNLNIKLREECTRHVTLHAFFDGGGKLHFLAVV